MLARMRFSGVWRDYQAQVLEAVGDHLADRRLHVVAAPGAGKTVLGLEIVRRLGRPALVFAPTTAIRDQWEQRLVPLFLDRRPDPDEVSRELAAPSQLTLATYQSLDTFRRSDELDRLISALDALGPITLVLDEAHHLRREWWSSLERLSGALEDCRIVALTATPPYDASFAEWNRYESLCGPIDLEIGIPELVRNGDLCPHQDHVILSTPTDDALKLIDARRRAISNLQRDLWADQDLLDELQGHPWLVNPKDHADEILEAPEMLSAVLVLLAGAGRKLPRAPLALLGVSTRRIPQPSFFWLEHLLEGLLHRHLASFAIGDAKRKALRQRLHRHGLIEGKRVNLGESRAIFRLMTASLAKLDSIERIAHAERRSLGDDLRMVVLSDHIRADELPAGSSEPFQPAKLGVAPIFEHLRRAGIDRGALGILTGSLVVVPRAALPKLEALAAKAGLDQAAVRVTELPVSCDYARIDLARGSLAQLVQLVTELFAEGDIRILVGTQSLLGEGWDAPCLNSLVLASNTASYMLSNQMRGRAIRIDPRNPAKVSSIWHLATAGGSPPGLLTKSIDRLNWGHLADDVDGTGDIALLERRFRGFEGISNGSSSLIESGIGRLGLDLTRDFQAANLHTLATAADRSGVAAKWATSLGEGDARARVRETAAPNYSPRFLAWSDTLRALTWAALAAAAYAVGDELRSSDPDVGASLMTLAGAGALASLPSLAKAARLIWRNGSIEGNLKQVGRVVIDALSHAGLIGEAEASIAQIDIRTSVDGRKDIGLRRISRAAEREVMKAISEVLGPIQNPRYMLVRQSWLGPRRRTDYHAVPTALGAKGASAEHFARLWSRHVGSSRLVFTRTPQGRRALLRARAKSFSAGFQRSVDRRSVWL